MRRPAAAIAEARPSRAAASGGVASTSVTASPGAARRSASAKRQPDMAAAGDEDVAPVLLPRSHSIVARLSAPASLDRSAERWSIDARPERGRIPGMPSAIDDAARPYSISSRSSTISSAARSPQVGLAARLRRPGHRPGAGRRRPHRRGPRTRIRCTPISCGPAIRRCRSSTRSTASATARASPRAASSPSSMARRSSPCRPPSRCRRAGLDHQIPMPKVPPPEELPSEAELRERSSSRTRPEPSAATGSATGRSSSARSTFATISAASRSSRCSRSGCGRPERSPDDPDIHRCVLAYASDMTLLDTALFAHGRVIFDRDHPGGEPRPRALVPPAVSRRRMAALCRGQPVGFRRPRLQPRQPVQPRRPADRLGRPGGADPPRPTAAKSRMLPTFLVISARRTRTQIPHILPNS